MRLHGSDRRPQLPRSVRESDRILLKWIVHLNIIFALSHQVTAHCASCLPALLSDPGAGAGAGSRLLETERGAQISQKTSQTKRPAKLRSQSKHSARALTWSQRRNPGPWLNTVSLLSGTRITIILGLCSPHSIISSQSQSLQSLGLPGQLCFPRSASLSWAR